MLRHTLADIQTAPIRIAKLIYIERFVLESMSACMRMIFICVIHERRVHHFCFSSLRQPFALVYFY